MARRDADEPDDYTRIFVLGGRGCTEEDFRSRFEEFGEITNVGMVKDRETQQFKGITYITFSKTSEAMRAIEEMNGQRLGSSSRQIKVLLATKRRDGNNDPSEMEKFTRIFIIVPKTFERGDIAKKFKKYGDIQYIRIVTDRYTGEKKGFAYVKYFKPSHAAQAMEDCDASFKAIFAEPQDTSASQLSGYMGGYEEPPMGPMGPRMGPRPLGGFEGPGNFEAGPPRPGPPIRPQGPIDILRNFPHEGEKRLECMASPSVNQDQLYMLFDLVPGLEACELDPSTGIAYIQYSFPQAAAYAKKKLARMEYPPGFRLAIRYPQSGGYGDGYNGAGEGDPFQSMAANLNATLEGMMHSGDNSGMGQLVESLQKATAMLQGAKGGRRGGGGPLPGGRVRVNYSAVPLPPIQHIAPSDSPVVGRVFLVSSPEVIPAQILKDCLCRFGNLIEAFFVPGKNYGFAKFASQESADNAIATLDGQQIFGNTLKVNIAKPPKKDADEDGQATKRMRID